MLTAIVLTFNEEQLLPECLASLAWVPHITVFDSFSTDRTPSIARNAGAQVIQRVFDNYAAQRNAALQTANTEWVLFVDADERVPPPLATAIRQVLDRPQAGWWIPRLNYIFGRLTLHAGWYPDYQLRLLRRDCADYDPARPVHELVRLKGEAGYLSAPLVHLNYASVAEFISKQKRYAVYEAERLRAAGSRVRPWHLITRPLRQFYWRLITLEGWRDGLHGWRLSLLMGYFEWEKNRLLLQSSPAARFGSENQGYK